MEILLDTATKSPAGRKAFADEKMTVRFRAGAFERIDAVAGKNRRAEFIREAVEMELERREKGPRAGS